MKKFFVFMAIMMFATTSFAAVVVDEDGVGFVGKGDVQLVFTWNNAQLQQNAEFIEFRMATIEKVSWTCYKDGDIEGNSQTRKNTRAIDGSVAFDARKNNKGQVTGFNLNGFFPGEGDVRIDGPAYLSCPTNWVQIGDIIESEESDGELEVSVNGVDWFALPITQ